MKFQGPCSSQRQILTGSITSREEDQELHSGAAQTDSLVRSVESSVVRRIPNSLLLSPRERERRLLIPKFTLEPFEDDTVLYYNVALKNKNDTQTAALYFFIDIDNKNETSLTLVKIEVSFPDSDEATTLIPMNAPCAKSSTTRVELGAGNTIKLISIPKPTKIKVSLFFAELLEPVVSPSDWALGQHKVIYSFFARKKDSPQFGDCVNLPGMHGDDTGEQRFAYDSGALGWVNHELKESKNSGTENEDFFVFGRPIYAMDNGQVILAVDGNPDHPGPGKSGVTRITKGEWQSNFTVKDISLACLKFVKQDHSESFRIVVVSIDEADSRLRISVLETSPTADSTKQLSTIQVSLATAVWATAVGGRFVIVATTLGKSGTTVTLWEVDDGGGLIKRDSFSNTLVTSARVTALTSNRFVVALRKFDGLLSVIVCEVTASTKIKTLVSTDVEIIGEKFDIAKITKSTSQFATVHQNPQGKLHIIGWSLFFSGGISFLINTGDFVGEDVVNEISCATWDDADEAGYFGVATGQGVTARFGAWKKDPEAIIKQGEFVRSVESGQVCACWFKKEDVALLSRTSTSKMHLTALSVEVSSTTKKAVIKSANDLNETGVADLFRAARLGTKQPTLVTAVRTAAKVVKIIPWQYTDNNQLKVLYGNEIVTYNHLKFDSINDDFKNVELPVTVSKGTFLAQTGHSGSSSKPHLHLQADRVRPDELVSDVKELIVQIKMGKSPWVWRPMQFKNALARSNPEFLKEGGPDKNPLLAKMDGHGAYFSTYAVFPDE